MPTIITAGDSVSAASSLTAGNDGLLNIVVGPAGSKVTALTIDAAGNITFLKQPIAPVQSMVRLHTANGYGTTNTAIKRYGILSQSQGADVTYTDSATLGASFTINANGVYALSAAVTGAANNLAGLSVNSAQGTTSIYLITPVNRLNHNVAPGDNVAATSYVGYFLVGDVIRSHSDGQAAQNAAAELFTIVRVS